MFIEKIQQISIKLKKLFSSFKVVFPDDVPGNKSFAREILEDDIRKLEYAIVSLSKGILPKPYKETSEHEWPQVKVIVVEVNVVYDENTDQFCVFRKVSEDEKMYFYSYFFKCNTSIFFKQFNKCRIFFINYYYKLYYTNKNAFIECNCFSFYLGFFLRCVVEDAKGQLYQNNLNKQRFYTSRFVKADSLQNLQTCNQRKQNIFAA